MTSIRQTPGLEEIIFYTKSHSRRDPVTPSPATKPHHTIEKDNLSLNDGRDKIESNENTYI
jgi:hypothetical protein